MTYVSEIEVQWGSPRGGVTLVVLIRGRQYIRRVRPSDWVTIEEAAAILKKNWSTVYRWVQSGKVEARRKAGVVMIPLTEVKRVRVGGRRA